MVDRTPIPLKAGAAVLRASVLGLAGLITASLAAQEPAAGEVPALESFPTGKRLWITAVESTLQPLGWERFHARASGEISLLAPNDSVVEKDTVWAIQAPERLENERKALEIERQALPDKLADARWDIEEKRDGLETSLADLETQRRDLKSLLEEDANDLPASFGRNIQDSIDRLDLRIERLEAKLAPERVSQEIRHAQEQLRIALDRREMEFEILERGSRMTAGFTGRLHVLLPQVNQAGAARELPMKVWVEASQPIATLADDTAFEVVVQANDPILKASPLDQLVVHLEEGSQSGLVRARFSHMGEVDTGNRPRQVYVFRVLEEDAELARQVSSDAQIAFVYRDFPEPYRIIRKDALVTLAPEVLSEGGWGGLIDHLWPGARIVQMGLQTFAVAEPGTGEP